MAIQSLGEMDAEMKSLDGALAQAPQLVDEEEAIQNQSTPVSEAEMGSQLDEGEGIDAAGAKHTQQEEDLKEDSLVMDSASNIEQILNEDHVSESTVDDDSLPADAASLAQNGIIIDDEFWEELEKNPEFNLEKLVGDMLDIQDDQRTENVWEHQVEVNNGYALLTNPDDNMDGQLKKVVPIMDKAFLYHPDGDREIEIDKSWCIVKDGDDFRLERIADELREAIVNQKGQVGGYEFEYFSKDVSGIDEGLDKSNPFKDVESVNLVGGNSGEDEGLSNEMPHEPENDGSPSPVGGKSKEIEEAKADLMKDSLEEAIGEIKKEKQQEEELKNKTTTNVPNQAGASGAQSQGNHEYSRSLGERFGNAVIGGAGAAWNFGKGSFTAALNKHKNSRNTQTMEMSREAARAETDMSAFSPVEMARRASTNLKTMTRLNSYLEENLVPDSDGNKVSHRSPDAEHRAVGDELALHSKQFEREMTRISRDADKFEMSADEEDSFKDEMDKINKGLGALSKSSVKYRDKEGNEASVEEESKKLQEMLNKIMEMLNKLLDKVMPKRSSPSP